MLSYFVVWDLAEPSSPPAGGVSKRLQLSCYRFLSVWLPGTFVLSWPRWDRNHSHCFVSYWHRGMKSLMFGELAPENRVERF